MVDTEMIPTGAPNLNLVKQNDREKLLTKIRQEKQGLAQARLRNTKMAKEKNFREAFFGLGKYYTSFSKSKLKQLPTKQLHELDQLLARKAPLGGVSGAWFSSRDVLSTYTRLFGWRHSFRRIVLVFIASWIGFFIHRLG